MLMRHEDSAAIASFYGPRGPKGLTPDTIEKFLDKFVLKEDLRIAKEEELLQDLTRCKFNCALPAHLKFLKKMLWKMQNFLPDRKKIHT